MRLIAAFSCSASVILLTAGVARAQTIPFARPAIEAVAAISTSSDTFDDPFVVLDLATTLPVNDSFDIVIRPYARRLVGGDWDALFYQAQIRYQPAARVRIDAGIITSPIGLGVLELRPDLNPVVGYPFYYFGRLPIFDQYSNRVQVLSGGYPLGAVVSLSGARWDARAGVTDSTPARYRKLFANGNPSPMPQFVAGGGITFRPGFRVGTGLARGKYRNSSDTDYYGTATGITNADAFVMNLEAELAFGYTRLIGEWVRDSFETDGKPAVTRGFYVQGVQTLTPRLFAATRVTHSSTPALRNGVLLRWTRTSAEVTGGYRLTPEFTLKIGYEGGHPYGVNSWNHAAVGQIVWAKRWF